MVRSAPTQKIEADLNGTGTLVDITSFVDQASGISHQWGRTDWTTPEPTPGTLTFTLENLDGRFTPGVTAVYDVGCVVGTLVQWTCGTRVKRFRMDVPEVSFPNGVAGSSMVTVQCFDALQLMAAKTMRALYDETVLRRSPAAYWVCDDAGTAECVDSSGNAEVSLVPVAAASVYEWQSNTVGTLAQDKRTTVYQNGTAHGGFVTSGLGLSGAWVWTNPSSTNYDVLGCSFWVRMAAVYPAENQAAASSAGPFVHLVSVGTTEVFFDIPHRGITFHDATASGSSSSIGTKNSCLYPGEWTHVAFVTSARNDGTFSNFVTLFVDGVNVADISLGSAGKTAMPGTVRTGGRYVPTATLGSATMSIFQGKIDRVAIHTPPGAVLSGTRQFAGGVLDMTQAGDGVVELSGARFQRLGRVLENTAVAFAPQGSSQPMNLSRQDTTGKSMLVAVCEALRAEDAGLDAIVLSGVETVRAWQYGSQKPALSVLTVDVTSDCVGVPTLSFDASGAAARVTAKNDFTGQQMVWQDVAVDARWKGTSTEISCLLDLNADILTAAQYRSLLGRVTGVVPQEVTVDAVSSTTDLTAGLLALHPWVTVTVQGFPDAVVGYGSVRCYLAGVKESHTLGASLFTLELMPTTALTSITTIDPGLGTEGPWRFSDFVEGSHAVGGGGSLLPLSNSATTVIVYTERSDPNTPYLSTTSGDYPLDIQVGDEIIHCPNVAGSPAAYLGGPWYTQTLTGCTRGYAGTTAVAHNWGEEVPAIVNVATVSGVHEDPYVMR